MNFGLDAGLFGFGGGCAASLLGRWRNIPFREAGLALSVLK